MKYVSFGSVKCAVIVGAVLVSLFACCSVKAVSGTSLEWNSNTDPSIAGYNIYYGGASRSYTNVLNAGNVTNAVVDGLVEGKTYYFAVTAYTYDGLESDFSDEYTFIVPGFLTMNPVATPDSAMQIRFPVAVGHWYELQQSINLVSWMTIWQTTGITNIWVEFDAPISTSGPVFYRVVQH